MLKITNLTKYKGLIITCIQTIVILLFAFVLTILKCGFDLQKFDFMTFAFTFVFTNSMKMIYTSYSKNKALLDDDIVILQKTIRKDKTQIFNQRKNEEFKQAIERRNKIKKLDALIVKLDNSNKNSSLRLWAFDYKQALINRNDIEQFERKQSLDSIKVAYEHIEFSKLFTYGLNEKIKKNKYTFNSFTTSFNRAILPTSLSIIFSVLFGTIQNESYLKTGDVWIDLAMYLFSIVLGAWWGLNNGKAIIQEDYAEVLNNVASLIREIKTEIGVVDEVSKQGDNNV